MLVSPLSSNGGMPKLHGVCGTPCQSKQRGSLRLPHLHANGVAVRVRAQISKMYRIHQILLTVSVQPSATDWSWRM